MKKNILLLIFLAALVFACDDFLTEEPEIAVTNNNFWKTEKDVESAVYGLHGEFRTVFGDVVMLYWDRGLPFDYLNAIWQYPSNNQPSYVWNASYPAISWANEYRVIAQANLIIDNIGRANLPEVRHNYYLGQAYCIRAYVYFYILRTWGDAPLIKESVDVGEKARASWQELADFAIGDLKLAVNMLPKAKDLQDASGIKVTSKQVPSSGTVHAILAHLYAWKAALNNEPELNKLAIAEADSVIKYGGYSLAGSPKEVCDVVMLGNSDEGIFEIDYQDLPGDLKGSGAFIAGACQKWPIQPLTTPATRRSLMRLNNSTAMKMYMDVSDERRDEYFYKLDSMAGVSTSVTQGAAYISKWRGVITNVGGSGDGTLKAYEDNEILIRLADIILLRAEVKVKTGDTQGAINDLNTIRARAGAPLYSASEGDLQEAIAKERDKELFLEAGIRFYDIIRNGTFREKLRGKFKTLTDQDVADGAYYLPVGNGAFTNNTLMKQTVYWKRNGYAY